MAGGLTFADFAARAANPALSDYERVDFPVYRAGKESAIYRDILSKLTNLDRECQNVVEIGPGCSLLAYVMMAICRKWAHDLTLVDCREMLDQLPNLSYVTRYAAQFPKCPELLKQYQKRVNVILAYSVIHHVYIDSNPFEFVDAALDLLAEGGQLLIGDIPNVSKRARFFNSPAGMEYHRRHMPAGSLLVSQPVEAGRLDDSVILAIVARCRARGFDAYILPQSPDLPMANRREDILVVRP